MKKILLSAAVVVAFIVYTLIGKKNSDSAKTTLESTNSPTPESSPQISTVNYKDGTYTSDAVNFIYGKLQVETKITNGKIAEVTFLQYPNDRPQSIEINQQAMPVLQAEAIKAQSNQVDLITGATDTAKAFIEALGTALVKAKNS